MNGKTLWILAIVITLASAAYQRLSGPTYPVRLNESLGGVEVKAKLPRSHSTSSDMPVSLTVPAEDAEATLRWRRWPTDEPWTDVPMVRTGQDLVAAIPAQPSAGKVEYSIRLHRGRDTWMLTGRETVVARFKGDVPGWVLAPHILAMFLGMLWSNRTGLGALKGEKTLRRHAGVTLGLLVAGGLILGPIVQKYAFGAYWTGWPLGEDLTDNKLAAAVLAWLIAVLAARGRRIGARARAFAVIAALVVLAVYMIPHSMSGSTLDYATGETVSG